MNDDVAKQPPAKSSGVLATNQKPSVATVATPKAGRRGAPKQIPGCLPKGYDMDSLLTVEQFALWRQKAISTIRGELPITKGVVRHSREDIRIHPRTYLALKMKLKI